jgi:hypothetical protein
VIAYLSFLILALIAFVALVQSPLLLASLSLVLLLSFVVFKSSTGVGGLLLLLLLLLSITLSLLTALVFNSILLLAPLSMPDYRKHSSVLSILFQMSEIN